MLAVTAVAISLVGSGLPVASAIFSFRPTPVRMLAMMLAAAAVAIPLVGSGLPVASALSRRVVSCSESAAVSEPETVWLFPGRCGCLDSNWTKAHGWRGRPSARVSLACRIPSHPALALPGALTSPLAIMVASSPAPASAPLALAIANSRTRGTPPAKLLRGVILVDGADDFSG